jgi:hypothetical protein
VLAATRLPPALALADPSVRSATQTAGLSIFSYAGPAVGEPAPWIGVINDEQRQHDRSEPNAHLAEIRGLAHAASGALASPVRLAAQMIKMIGTTQLKIVLPRRVSIAPAITWDTIIARNTHPHITVS